VARPLPRARARRAPTKPLDRGGAGLRVVPLRPPPARGWGAAPTRPPPHPRLGPDPSRPPPEPGRSRRALRRGRGAPRRAPHPYPDRDGGSFPRSPPDAPHRATHEPVERAPRGLRREDPERAAGTA